VHVTASPHSQAGREALSIYESVLRAVKADALMERAVSLQGDTLRIGEVRADLTRVRRTWVVGAGKASAVMAQSLEAVLGDRIAGGVVVTKHGHRVPTRRIEILEAGHPVPDEASVAAGRAIANVAQQMSAGDLALVLISGGASALMELPADDVGLADIQTATDLLLRCGATIDDLNSVRARISRLKAGGLARMLAPARVVCLVMSDVLGNPLGVIGSGPCWTDSDAMPDARQVIERHGLAGRMPAGVMERVQAASRRADQPADVTHVIIGDIHTALDAAVEASRSRGHRPAILTSAMRGEAREIARLIAGMTRDLPATQEANGLDCLLLGGEPTVTVLGNGMGGRCQELACAAAPYLDGVEGVALLAAGTDGTDGPTDAAGALVDGSTQRRIAELGGDIGDALARSDTYHLLDAAECLIRSGPTGSNVGDVVIALLSS